MFYVTYINMNHERKSKIVFVDDLCKVKSFLLKLDCYCITHCPVDDGLDLMS